MVKVVYCVCLVVDGKFLDIYWLFWVKKISFNLKLNIINELLYVIYVRCICVVRICVFIIFNGFIFMYCNCIYDKWLWCVLVKKDIYVYWIYLIVYGYFIIDFLIDFFLILGNVKFV